MKPEARQAILEAVAHQVAGCTLCALHQSRQAAIPGEGPLKADVLFVTPAPTPSEDAANVVLVGRAGIVFDQLLSTIGLTRAGVFVTPLVKCRPPHGHTPSETEIETCTAYLNAQIRAVDPLIVALLGRASLTHFFPEAALLEAHGELLAYADRFYFPLHHPSAIEQNPGLRPVLEADFRALGAAIQHLKERIPPSSADNTPPAQLPLL
ncbi:MAG: uracil-DNA glycosylase [Anaerolineales bacterium]